jgi:hypothetical protein
MLIPRPVQILCSECFSECKSLLSISFDIDSELRYIESYAIASCSSLKSMTLPQDVELINGLAFSHVSNISISIASDNLNFAVKTDFIMDSLNTLFIRYFSNKSNVSSIDCGTRDESGGCSGLERGRIHKAEGLIRTENSLVSLISECCQKIENGDES